MGVTKKTTAQKLEKHRVDEMNGAVISESLTKIRQEKLADGDQRVPLFFSGTTNSFATRSLGLAGR
ncbi:hypothetical protein P9726_05170 [Geobacillus stearothermophilus]|uniref:hypothetical protein n=1 Tax=Geobacillus stearothermophilus TaxID=1422 RepID=UPI002E1A79BA|nr:hypothetical protein [Geobacillus stearothermophilus]